MIIIIIHRHSKASTNMHIATKQKIDNARRSAFIRTQQSVASRSITELVNRAVTIQVSKQPCGNFIDSIVFAAAAW